MSRFISAGIYACSYCGKRYNTVLYADGCEKAHKLIYIPIPIEDLQALVQFIYTGDKTILFKYPNIAAVLTRYLRTKPTIDDVSEVKD